MISAAVIWYIVSFRQKNTDRPFQIICFANNRRSECSFSDLCLGMQQEGKKKHNDRKGKKALNASLRVWISPGSPGFIRIIERAEHRLRNLCVLTCSFLSIVQKPANALVVARISASILRAVRQWMGLLVGKGFIHLSFVFAGQILFFLCCCGFV
jgi:hypothetical protein